MRKEHGFADQQSNDQFGQTFARGGADDSMKDEESKLNTEQRLLRQ